MSPEAKPINIKIMDKEYLISCPENERDQLYNAAEMVNSKMSQIKNAGSVIGSERIAVMAALNIAHELLDYRDKNAVYTSRLDDTIRRLQGKIHNALGKGEQLEI